MGKVNPRRHYWQIIRAHSLLGATLKSVLDYLHPSDNDPVEAPQQVLVASEATADGQPVPAGSVIIVQAGGVPVSPASTPPIAAEDLQIGSPSVASSSS